MNETRYFTGLPCKRGHVSEREKSSRQCIACRAESRQTEVYKKQHGARTAKFRQTEHGRAQRNHLEMVRHAAKLQRTPEWLTEEHLNSISEIYKRAVQEGLHVDHIVPLRGETVSGLHVPWNLQLLTKSENSRKSNKWTFSKN